jgi:hypothetical protein
MAEKSDKYSKLAFVLMASDSMSNVLEKAAQNLDGSFSKMEQRMAKIATPALRVGTQMQLMGQQIIAPLKNAVMEGAEYIDNSMKTAKAIGIQTEEWQKLSYAARYAGVENDLLQTSLIKFNNTIVETLRGNKSNVALFKALGVSIKDTSGKVRSTDSIFKDVTEAFSKLEDGAVKSAAEMELFGKGGTKLASLLAGGKKGLEDLGKEAERLGLTMDDKRMEEFNDS